MPSRVIKDEGIRILRIVIVSIEAEQSHKTQLTALWPQSEDNKDRVPDQNPAS